MKKISFLIGSLGGGGAERVTVALADYFCESGYEVFFIVFSKANNNYRINPKIKIDYLPENTGKCAIFFRIKELKKLLKNQAPDYVISLGLGYQYLILGNLLNKYRFILSERNAPQYYYNWYQKIYVKYSYEKAYRVVFQTEDAKQYYGKSLEKKSKVIANPITSSIPDPYDGEREKRIVAVNRLSQQKNIFMLLRAMKRVLDVFPEYVLEIYGKGEQQEELEKYAKELNISDNVKFMGQKANVQTYIVNASRCNNFHGNVAARMNSINANKDTFKMYTDMFLTEYIILAIHLNSQGALSDVVLNKVKKNANLMI